MSRAIVRPSGEIIDRPQRGGLFIWALAVLVGALIAVAVVIVVGIIAYAQFVAFGAVPGRLASRLVELPWWSRLIAPLVGGSIIALLLRLGISFGWGSAPRAYGLQDVVQHRRLRGTIRATTMTLRDGFLSAVVAIVSLGWGGSAGREEPAAHLGATIAVLHGRLLGLNVASRRMLVGMGVAAAIAAVMHSPIAAVFLVRELVLRRQRVSALGPVAVAAVAAWLMSVWLMNGRPLISIPPVGNVPVLAHVATLVALPVLIGIAYLCSMAWTRAPVLVASTAGRIGLPLWLLPVFGGLMLGVIAMAFPQALGIGFEPMAAGLSGNFGAAFMPVLAFAKIAAVSVTVGFRWGGGAMAPAMFVGALIGSSLAVLAGIVFGIPAPQVYLGLVGMAVCVAVLLDAPMTAAILVLELSGSTAAGASSLVCCYLACMVARRLSPPKAEETGQTLRWR
jgi:CIC family chloride channel protein